jgi:DNA-binding MarR family transcriptional regulator
MNEPLSVAENQVLTHLLTDGGAVEESELDGDVVRTLEERGMVRCLGGFAIISAKGREVLRQTPSPESPWTPAPRPQRRAAPRADEPLAAAAEPAAPGAERPAEAADDQAPKVNTLQEDLLRRLVQEAEPVPVDDLDGRVVRALEGRGLVRRNAGVLEVTEAGREFYERHVRRRRRARSGWLRVGGTAPAAPADPAEERRQRADALRRAIAALEQALSGETTIEVGDEAASAAQALAGLRDLADRVERGDDPRRVGRNRKP